MSIDTQKFLKSVIAMKLRVGIVGMPYDIDIMKLLDELEGHAVVKVYDPLRSKYISKLWNVEVVPDIFHLDTELILVSHISEQWEADSIKRAWQVVFDPLGLLGDWTNERLDLNDPDFKMLVYLRTEKEIVKKLRRIKGELFVDVGAFLGEYTINLADNFREVFAFEPASDSREQLVRNLELFEIKNVKVYSEALHSSSGTAQLFRKAGHHGGMTSLKQEYIRGEEPETLEVSLEQVKTETLDNIIGNRKITLLKIDVEGSELDVLQGGLRALLNTEKVLIEIHNPKEKETIQQILELVGFTKFSYLSENHLFAERGA